METVMEAVEAGLNSKAEDERVEEEQSGAEKALVMENDAAIDESTTEEPSVKSMENGSSGKENEEPKIEKEDASPPRPDTAPVLIAPLTIDDTIKLDTSQVPRPDDNVSLIVNVDDTQNDLDSDLLGSISVKSSKPGTPEHSNNNQSVANANSKNEAKVGNKSGKSSAKSNGVGKVSSEPEKAAQDDNAKAGSGAKASNVKAKRFVAIAQINGLDTFITLCIVNIGIISKISRFSYAVLQ